MESARTAIGIVSARFSTCGIGGRMMHDPLPTQLADQAAAGPPGLSDALQIWWAGVSAVTPQQLFASQVRLENRTLIVGDDAFDLRGVRRIVVVGAGKASAGMASALYENFLKPCAGSIDIAGWINAPEGSFQLGSAGPIHLHAARPAGINEPTAAAVSGTEQIIKMVEQCRADDLCIVLLSGGGSAMLAAPIEGVTLNDKQQVARRIGAAGGNIQQLNTVRRALSRVKGGGLASRCGARQLVSLIISDVLGDPLETIASGPTVRSAAVPPMAALAVLDELELLGDSELRNVISVLHTLGLAAAEPAQLDRRIAPVSNIVLANNATAVDAAGVKAVELGYRYVMQAARTLEGDVAQLAQTVGRSIEQLSGELQIDCWISGGEPTVKLPPPEVCGLGGRNQQLVLLSLLELARLGWPDDHLIFPNQLLFLSAGTDGEDGPTTAAGAWFDNRTLEHLARHEIDVNDFAARADAYSLFSRCESLVVSGPTGTNVCDLRIALKVKPSYIALK